LNARARFVAESFLTPVGDVNVYITQNVSLISSTVWLKHSIQNSHTTSARAQLRSCLSTLKQQLVEHGIGILPSQHANVACSLLYWAQNDESGNGPIAKVIGVTRLASEPVSTWLIWNSGLELDQLRSLSHDAFMLECLLICPLNDVVSMWIT